MIKLILGGADLIYVPIMLHQQAQQQAERHAKIHHHIVPPVSDPHQGIAAVIMTAVIIAFAAWMLWPSMGPDGPRMGIDKLFKK